MRESGIALLLLVSTALAASQIAASSGQHSVSCEHVLGLTYIEATVNGSRPLTMVLDSGASYTVLQPGIAAELGIKPTGTQQTTGAGANATLHMVQNATLNFAGETLTGQTISVLPVDYIDKEAGHKTDGLLGGNIFTHFVVREDYRAHTVALIPPATFTAPPGYTAVPVVLAGNIGLVQPTLTGAERKPVQGTFLIDSGDVGNMLLMKPFLDANPSLEPTKTVAMPSVTAVGGKLDVALGRMASVRIGRFDLRNPVAALMRSSNPAASATLAGLLGNGILRKFDVIFDYPHSKLWLRPNADFNRPFPENASGILLSVDPPHYNAVLVRDVLAGSPSAQAGVQPGDRIVHIRLGSGGSLNVNSLAQVNDALSKPGERVTLQLNRAGKLITLRFETRSLI